MNAPRPVFLFLSATLLGGSIPLSAQITQVEEREAIIAEAQRILAHPGDRPTFSPEDVGDIFFPGFSMDLMTPPAEVLRAFRSDFQVRGLIRRTGQEPVLSVVGRGAVRVGQALPFTYEGEQFSIVVAEIGDDFFILQLNSETLRVSF